MKEASKETTFNQLCNDIREARCLAEEQKSKLTKIFGSRFITAYTALENEKVKKYVFHPSGRIVWIVTGKERDYQILPLANFCSCFDFYFRVIDHETSLCYHLLAQKLSEALEKYVVIEKPDTSFMLLMKKWGKAIGRKRELSITEVENIRRIVIAVLSEEKQLSLDRLLGELREAGFALTTRHLVNILIADKAKRFKHVNKLWALA